MHYHKGYMYNELIFDKVGIQFINYNYDDTDFTQNSSHTYTEIGDYTIKQKVTNYYGLSKTCSTVVRVKYNTPSSFLIKSIESPILNNNINIQLLNNDIDNRITATYMYMDSDLKTTSTTFNHLLDVFKEYESSATIHWNDGFEDHTYEVQRNIVLDNIPPETDLKYEWNLNNYTFISNAYDFEDLLEEVEFKLYIDSNSILEETPEEPNWSYIDNRIVEAEDWNQDLTFYKGGKFKMECTAFDGVHHSAPTSVEFSVDGASADTTTNFQQYIEWE